MNNPFTQRLNPHSPALSISLLSLVLGLMIGLAFIKEGNRKRVLEAIAQRDPSQANRLIMNPLDPASKKIQDDMKELQETISVLRAKNAGYEKVLAQKSGESKALASSIEDANKVAGLTELVGPGVLITLKDAQQGQKRIDDQSFIQDQIVHDLDILRMVNELWNAGAEAIAVNGQRIAVGTSIRCVGTVIRINDVPQAPPYSLVAIGDAKTLAGAMALPGGVVQELQDIDPKMVKIETVDKVRIPAFSGSMAMKYGRVPKDTPKP